MEKEMKITIPEGYEIDKEKSSFEKIVFKKIEPTKWRDKKGQKVGGYYINYESKIKSSYNIYYSPLEYLLFAEEKQAKSALAMARISQIMVNDKRFGGIITDNEWKNNTKIKYVISKQKGTICNDFCYVTYQFLAFHTSEQRNLFMEENMDLIKDYFMIE